MTYAALGMVLVALVGEDCNRNGREDALDVSPGAIRFSDPLPHVLRMPSRKDHVVIVDVDGTDGLEMVLANAGGVTVARSDDPSTLLSVQELPVGSNLRAMISADVDGDGDPDIVTANGLASGHPGNVSVFRNHRGLLEVPRNYAGSLFPGSIGAGDLDSDSDVDLVTVGGTVGDVTDGLTVLRNDGTGRFELFGRYPTGIDPAVGEATVADLDGDGALDVVMAKPDRRDSIQVFRGDGRGRLELPLGLELPSDVVPTQVIVLDADGDGDLDIGSLARGEPKDSSGAVYLLQNVGGGPFVPAARIADIPVSMNAAVADLDADGWMDVALGHPFVPAATVLRGSGAGGFLPPRTRVLPLIAEKVAAADWDHDGHTDLVAMNPVAGLATVLPGTSFATSGPSPVRYPIGESFEPLFADIDEDADKDLVISVEPDSLGVFRNEGGDLKPIETFSSGEVDRVLSADIDGDGRVDLACSSDRGLEVFFGNGRGGFEPQLLPMAGGLSAPFIADLDGDGDLDVLASSWTREGIFALFRNVSVRRFELPELMVPGTDGGFHTMPPVPLDFDGDGDMDVLGGRGLRVPPGPVTGTDLVILENRGAGVFDVNGIETMYWSPLIPVTRDLDEDGRTDVVVGSPGGPGWRVHDPGIIFVLHGREDGLSEVERHQTRGVPGRLHLRDMDGDRDPDVVHFGHHAGASFHVLRNDGSGRFALETVSGIRALWGTLIAEDLDADGDTDVAAIGSGPSPAPCHCHLFQVDVFRNRGDATFDAPSSFLTVSAASIAETAPLRPGPPDLLLIDSNGLTVLRNLTEAPASRDTDGNGVPDECQALFHRGDPSGDGASDISDAMVVLLHLFLGAPEPGCLDAADANDDGRLDIADPILVLKWLFLGGPSPLPPGPPGGPCGPDPPGSTLGCEGSLGCGA